MHLVQVQPPIRPEDCVNGSAALWWEHNVNAHTTLWQLASECTAHVREALAARAGLAWWHYIMTEFYAPPYSVCPGDLWCKIIYWRKNERQ